jgi:hypothetical protein
VNLADVSNECIRELAEQAFQGARLMKDMNYQPFYTALDERLKQQAAIVFEYWNGCNIGFEDGPQIRTLTKHKVRKRSESGQ